MENSEKKSGSLVLYITLIYIFLAIINIVFFTVMIFENQMDLMVTNFKFHSENLINSVLYELDDVRISDKNDQDLEKLSTILLTNGIDRFVITDKDNKIIHNISKNEKLVLPDQYDRKIREIKNLSSYMKSRYNVELNSRDFTVQFILPVTGAPGNEYFLYTTVSIKIILDRLKLLYFQLALAIIWGLVFHTVFALFVYKLIFKRLNKLSDASRNMGQGDLTSRANWDFKRNDELDSLGKSFNVMAEKIEDTVSSLRNINDQMQLELEVGKQVQELFLPASGKYFREFNIECYFRPMREVSGDVYNYYKFGDKLQSVFLADATGHGVSAALVTSVIVNNLNNLVQETYIPGKLLQKLNVIIYEALQSAFYATGVMFMFDLQGNVYYSIAGHNPPLYFNKKEGVIEKLYAKNTILGLEENSEYKTHKMTARSGDKFFFYSDGLVESANTDNLMFGLEKVERLLLDNQDKSNKEIIGILTKELNEFTSEFRDDVTFILLEIP